MEIIKTVEDHVIDGVEKALAAGADLVNLHGHFEKIAKDISRDDLDGKFC